MAFPNREGKHAEEALFTPGDFMAYLRNVGKYPDYEPPVGAILCYQKHLMSPLLEGYQTTKASGFCSSMYTIDDTGGRVAVLGGFGFGAPVAVSLLEELIAFGVRRFVSFGTAGTLQKDIDIGSLIVCDRAIRDEGTSHHYVEPSKYAYASERLTGRLKEALQRHKQEYIVGTSWTIDAPYRETVVEARLYQEEGVAAVDMEASALFAVAQYRGVELGAMFMVSDSLAELEWRPEFHKRNTMEELDAIYKAAIAALLG